MFSFPTIVKRVFWAACLCLNLILFSLPSYALNLQDIPHPRQFDEEWIADIAQIVNSDIKAQLNHLISELKQKTGDEIFIVTVPETRPALTPKIYAIELFNHWRIGNIWEKGILFLISVENRRVEIKTGYGVRDRLPDALVDYIIQKEIIPQFKEGNFSKGILAGTKLLSIKLETITTQKTHNSELERLSPAVLLPLVLFLLLFIALVVFSLKFILPANMVDEISHEINNTRPLLVKELDDFDGGGGGDGGGSGGDDGGGGGSW